MRNELWQRWANVVLCCVFSTGVVLACEPAAESLENTPENRLAAAEAYLKAQPMDVLLKKQFDELTGRMPSAQQDRMRDILSRVDAKGLEDIARQTLIAHFTAEELQCMADFYGSETGQAITRKMPAFTSDLIPQVLMSLHQNLMPQAAPAQPAAPEQ